MSDHSGESGLELVLDNRKLIIAFVLLIAICGCFFVIGFVEGKRQGAPQGAQTSTEPQPRAVASEPIPPPAPAPAPSTAGAEPAKDNPEEQKLDWYKNVSGHALPHDAVLKPMSSAPPAERAQPQSVTYSVQVGAFSQKHALEAQAQALRSKGYECRIEPPRPPDQQLYLLKVGTFHSRAEAAAMQLRLKKSGFSCIIKAN